jgi:hypothetical protein
MKFFGNIAIYLGLFIIFQFSGLSGRTGFEFGSFLVGLLLAAPFLMLGSWAIGREEDSAQTTIDTTAATTLTKLRAGVKSDVFLYLRPFDSTNAYRLSDQHLNLFSWELWERDGFDDIERLVARALKPTATLITLGRPGEHRGAARVLTTEAEWRNEVALLCEAARLIVIIPSSNPGTLWELKHIKIFNYAKKTIFIMPPSDNVYYVSNAKSVSTQWKSTRQACKEIGISLPAHQPGGSLFALNEDYEPSSMIQLPSPDPIKWMEAFQKLIDEF